MSVVHCTCPHLGLLYQCNCLMWNTNILRLTLGLKKFSVKLNTNTVAKRPNFLQKYYYSNWKFVFSEWPNYQESIWQQWFWNQEACCQVFIMCNMMFSLTFSKFRCLKERKKFTTKIYIPQNEGNKASCLIYLSK